MRKIWLCFLILSLLMFGINVVNADVPTVTDIGVTVETDGRTLTITVRHSSPSNIHYVSEIEVKVGEDTMVVELDPQTDTSFIEEVDVEASGNIQVRAYCTLHGWSGWASLGGASDPVDDTSGGISGFPFISIIIGFSVLVLIHKRNR